MAGYFAAKGITGSKKEDREEERQGERRKPPATHTQTKTQTQRDIQKDSFRQKHLRIIGHRDECLFSSPCHSLNITSGCTFASSKHWDSDPNTQTLRQASLLLYPSGLSEEGITTRMRNERDTWHGKQRKERTGQTTCSNRHWMGQPDSKYSKYMDWWKGLLMLHVTSVMRERGFQELTLFSFFCRTFSELNDQTCARGSDWRWRKTHDSKISKTHSRTFSSFFLTHTLRTLNLLPRHSFRLLRVSVWMADTHVSQSGSWEFTLFSHPSPHIRMWEKKEMIPISCRFLPPILWNTSLALPSQGHAVMRKISEQKGSCQ